MVSIDPIQELKELKVAHVKCKSSLLFYTRYFFVKQYSRKFVVNSHHEKICSVLDAVFRGELTKVIFNVAPRYGKTEIAVKNFISAGLAINPSARFIHLSYSNELALDNSEGVKDIVNLPDYNRMFPYVKIKYGSDSKKKWYTTEGGGVYATSTGGQVTGFGAGRVEEEDTEDVDLSFLSDLEAIESFAGSLVIDDPIKIEDASSELKRERINQRWDGTIKNRVNSRKTPLVLMGQRTHENDLSGHVMKTDGFVTNIEDAKANPDKWLLVSLPSIIDFGLPTAQALWPFKHTLAELLTMRRADSLTFDTQYQQDPTPKEGLMYDTFRTYNQIPHDESWTVKSYTDTADKGKDFLFQCVYVETKSAMYVQDIIYTQLPMKDTEPMCAVQLHKYSVDLARFESNNGGEGFARSVEKQTRVIGNNATKFKTFHQSDNKEVRIFNNSAKVTNLIYMPHDWKDRWPLVYKHVTGYLKSGKNESDDPEDGLTGMVEFFGKHDKKERTVMRP